MKNMILRLTALSLLFITSAVADEVRVSVGRNEAAAPYPAFHFAGVPAPKRMDLASSGTFSVVDGVIDSNSGGVHALQDGLTPVEADQPRLNFFFAPGSGGRLRLDLQKATDIQAIDTYSRHPRERAAQVYTVYGSDGSAPAFDAAPKRSVDPQSAGWKLIARVDTRSSGTLGGTYGVSIKGIPKSLGRFRFLMFDIEPTETSNAISNTFYSEIDVIADGQSLAEELQPPKVQNIPIEGGRYTCVLDVSATPELALWAHTELVPVVQAWYPRLIAMLPSSGFQAPPKFSITFLVNKDGVATTTGTAVSGAAAFYRREMNGEAVGSMVHEMVHVVQQYHGTAAPVWLSEGIADYIRFYRFEPETHGADIPPSQAAAARYDGSYRPTANFLNWASNRYNPSLVENLNAAIRTGHYSDEVWRKLTGHSLPELGQMWQQSLSKH
jgi:Peptidase of plants and bacteria